MNTTLSKTFIRGGETKVMKKTLSSLLVFALVLTMLVPAFAFAADAKPSAEEMAKQLSHVFEGDHNGNLNLDQNMDRASFAKVVALLMDLEVTAPAADATPAFSDVATNWSYKAGFIDAAVKAEYMKGTGNGQFSPLGTVSYAEVATVLARLVGVDSKEESNPWYAKNLAAVQELGFLVGLEDATAAAPRSVLVEAAWLADKALNATPVAPADLKVESVTATNLKEVVVTFNQKVDDESAEEVANYSLKSGKAIKSVALLADEASVRITLTGTLANHKAEALSISNVKAGDKVLNVKNIEFTTVDNEIPAVKEVQSLGTKSVKVVFTEPVQDLKQANFSLDGKAYFGKLSTDNGRSVVLTPFSTSALAVGEHTLTVSGVKDYANFTSLTSNHSFTVVEDTEAPAIVEATATLESVTLTFSEDVDVETVSGTYVYWKSGTTAYRANATPVQLAGNKFKFNFGTANTLPTGSVVIYVEGVKDYSGNEIAKDTKVVVSPTIDQTRPEVKKVTVLSATSFKVTFTKGLEETSAEDVNNYTVLNKDDKVISVADANRVANDTTSVIVDLYSSLSVGNNTLTIKNVKDSTKLQNTMLDYTGTITRGDTANPFIDSTVKSDKDLRVIVKFNKKMNVESLADYSNYLVVVDGKLQALSPAIADISVLQDATAVAITFVENINDTPVNFGARAGHVNVSQLQILGVKDTSNNLLKEFADANGDNRIDLTAAMTVGFGNYDDEVGYVAALTGRKTIEVKFTSGINEVLKGAFSLENGSGSELVSSVNVNGTSIVVVNLSSNLETDGSDVELYVDFTKLVSMSGERLSVDPLDVFEVSNTVGNLLDYVDPVVAGNPSNNGKYAVSGQTIDIVFSEDLTDHGAPVELVATDFKVTRVTDNKVLTAGTHYTASVLNDTVTITLLDQASRKVDSFYRVEVLSTAKYVTDLSGNTITAAAAKETNAKVSFVAVVSSIAISGDAEIAVPASGDADNTATYTAVVKDQNGATLGGETVTWSLQTAVAGVSVNATTGVVTVVDEDTTVATSFTLVATSDTLGSVVATKKVTLAQP